MNQKLISVIVPIYNVEKYLRKCIDSIINQTYKNLEIILIDDGSTDNSSSICDEYKKKDNRIVVIHKTNGGLSSARNKGLDISNGELISFVDSDDYIESNMLECLKANMDKYSSDISVCDFYYVKNGNKRKSKTEFKKKEYVSSDKDKFNNIQNEYGPITVYVWNKLFKKEVFNNIRFPEGKIYEDSFVICELLDYSKKVSYILKPLYYYVYRKDSITNTFNIKHFDKIDSCNEIIRFFNNKGYYDLAQEEKNKKMSILIVFLSKIDRYKTKNKDIIEKYYQELYITNKEVRWRNALMMNKYYKLFGKALIILFSFVIRFRHILHNKYKVI